MLKLKKFIKMITTVIIIATMCTVAYGDSLNENILNNSSNITQEFLNVLKTYDVHIDENTTIQMLPTEKNTYSMYLSNDNSENEATAILVTNYYGNTVTKDILLTIKNEEDNQNLSNANVSTYSSSSAEYPPLSWDGRYVVKATAVYNLYYEDICTLYYQPIGAYFSYKKYAPVDISEIEIIYICDGFVYSNPDFKSLGYETAHIIERKQNNPSPNTSYHSIKNFDANKVLDISGGSPYVGQSITFNIVANGDFDSFTIRNI